MECPACGVRTVTFEVPIEFRQHVPQGADTAALCPVCLTLQAANGHDPDPQFDRISSAFPTDEAAAVPLAIAIGLLDSIALNRDSLETLLSAVERAGTDPMLVLDRLHAQGDVQPEFDIRRRRHQLLQLL